MLTNPFTFGRPVFEPGRFVGRREEISQVVNRLRSSAHESTSIVGERRMGKTSLLRHLAQPQVAASLGLDPRTYRLIYLDLQGASSITPQRFWEQVLKLFRQCQPGEDVQKAIDQLAQRGNFDIFDLEELMDVVQADGLNLVLLLDEFETITQNTNFGMDAFGGLRSLAIHHPLTLITSTCSGLEDLCHSDEIKSSPFFNIFATVVLRPLGPEDAAELVTTQIKHCGLTIQPEEKELALRLGGGHPFFLQMAGYYLFDGKQRGLANDPLAEYIHAQFKTQAAPHFKYMWESSSESQKITLLTVIVLGQQKGSPPGGPVLEQVTRAYSRASFDLDALLRRGLLTVSAGHYAPFSPALGRWILAEIQAIPGEEDEADFNQWLNQGGLKNNDATQAMRGFKSKYWPLIASLARQVTLSVAEKTTTGLILQLLQSIP